jgi:hypothetical protein
MCNKFYLFEPITTMVLVTLCSAVHVVRVHAIYDKSRAVLGGLGAVLLVQVSVQTLLPILRRAALHPTCVCHPPPRFPRDDACFPAALSALRSPFDPRSLFPLFIAISYSPPISLPCSLVRLPPQSASVPCPPLSAPSAPVGVSKQRSHAPRALCQPPFRSSHLSFSHDHFR